MIDEAQYLLDSDEILRPFCVDLIQKMTIGSSLIYIKEHHPESFEACVRNNFSHGMDEALITIELNEFVENEIRLGISFRKAIRNAIEAGFGCRFTALDINKMKEGIK